MNDEMFGQGFARGVVAVTGGGFNVLIDWRQRLDADGSIVRDGPGQPGWITFCFRFRHFREVVEVILCGGNASLLPHRPCKKWSHPGLAQNQVRNERTPSPTRGLVCLDIRSFETALTGQCARVRILHPA